MALFGSEQFSGEEDASSYAKEIASMMHGFGDNPTPNAATVSLVESVVLQQMRGMVQEACRHADIRHAKSITNRDVVFLLRNNKVKLRRLYDFQLKVEMIREKTKVLSPAADSQIPELLLEDDVEVAGRGAGAGAGGGRRPTTEVIEKLDEVGELEHINFDTIKYMRQTRASKLTEAMSLAKYEAYCKARRVVFARPGFRTNKFKNWINPNGELAISTSAYDVLAYLAYETVAEIVDGVFLIRQDARKRSDDPFSKYAAGNFCNPVSLGNAVYIKSGSEGVPAIAVAEVRELLRRIFTPRQGVSGLFYRNMRMELPPKFIAT